MVVGVNRYRDPSVDDADAPFDLHSVDAHVEARQIERVRQVRACRDQAKVDAALRELQEAARCDDALTHNLLPPTIEAVRARATGGEVVNALREVYGRYVEAPVF